MIGNKFKKFLFPGIIALYCLLLIFTMKGSSNLYGATVDWISQHIAFPETFRQSFYDSKQLFPNFFYNIGSGQNAFYLTYHGFLSPVILLSYFLPFVEMVDYMFWASAVLYISCGILTYFFLKRHFGDLFAFASGMLFVTLPSVNFHFHHHLMFVWYLPFMLLALIGLDRYFNDGKKPVLFIVSTLLMIFTNYYFSVSALICLFIYALYNVFKKEGLKAKEYAMHIFEVVLAFATPVLLSGIILAPTAYVLLSGTRSTPYSPPVSSIFLPDISDLVFGGQGAGLCCILIACLVANLLAKGIKKCDVFLNVFLLFIVVSPLLSYALNGFLYARAKALIPFLILFVYSLCKFADNLSKNLIPLRKAIIGGLVLAVFYLAANFTPTNAFCALAVAIVLPLAILAKKRPIIIYVYTIIALIATVYFNSQAEEFVTKKHYDTFYKEEIRELMEKTDDGWFRTDLYHREKNLANIVFADNYYTTSIYSSMSNSNYLHFFRNHLGNNERYRNAALNTGSRNELFHTFMGAKYIISKTDPGLGYEPVAKTDNLTLYKNENAYPMVYKSKAQSNADQLKKAEFPFSAELLMTHTVTDNAPAAEYSSTLVPIEVPESYEFEIKKSKDFTYELDEALKGKLLYLSFDIITTGVYTNKEDLIITINGTPNKITEATWMYHNGNRTFEYVLSLEESTTLNVNVSVGKYKIENLKMYSSPLIAADYEEAENLKLDTFTGDITCNINADKGDYLVTSIPFDKGFRAYINGELCETETVNCGFLGVPLKAGENSIVIKYTAPWLFIGVLISMMGVALLIYLLLKKQIDALIKKYWDIFMYLVFGVLTTAVSLVSYFLCTYLFLDASDPLQLQAANIISWICSVTFAYFTNKRYVFRSNNSILKEAAKFYSSRLGTLVIDMGVMYLLVSIASVNDVIAKIIVQFIVLVSNYAISKFLVFRKNTKDEDTTKPEA